MNTQPISSTIKLNLPSGILRNAKAESQRIGISIQDFIRMLMATYFANGTSVRAVSRYQELFDRATGEIQTGKYKTVRTKASLDAYLDTLDT